MYIPPKPKLGRPSRKIAPASAPKIVAVKWFDSAGNRWLVPPGVTVAGAKDRLAPKERARVSLLVEGFVRSLKSGDLYVRSIVGKNAADIDVEDDEDLIL